MCPEQPGFSPIRRFFHQASVSGIGLLQTERQRNLDFGDRTYFAGGGLPPASPLHAAASRCGMFSGKDPGRTTCRPAEKNGLRHKMPGTSPRKRRKSASIETFCAYIRIGRFTAGSLWKRCFHRLKHRKRRTAATHTVVRNRTMIGASLRNGTGLLPEILANYPIFHTL